MKTSLKTGLSLLWTFALLLPDLSRAADAGKSTSAPPGSLIIRGDPKPAKATSESWIGSPEHSLGLAIEEAMKTNGYAAIVRAFDLTNFQRRVVSSLPASDEIKKKLNEAPNGNAKWKQTVLQDALADTANRQVRFLGVRSYGGENELLFRDSKGPAYVGYVVQRELYGAVRIVDTHRFELGEMQSQMQRRDILLGLAPKKLIVPPVTAADQALLSGVHELALFESRCKEGQYSLIKEAYEKLPPELQENRGVLRRYMTSGVQGLNDIIVPVERWRRVYPNDPIADLQLVEFYWQLCNGPKSVVSPSYEDGLQVAVQRANAWFADPAMEIRLATHLSTRDPAKAKALLEQAMKRFPVEPSAFAEMRKINLAAGDFTGVANMLHLEEQATKTDLSGKVNSSKEYEEFRKSFACKKWMHDYHGADARNLAAGE